MLFLSGADVRACLPCEPAMASVEEALAIQEGGAFSMPERLNMECGQPGNILLLMPCRTEQALATKLISVFPSNRAGSLPAINGLVVLNDAHTGEVLAVMDGQSVTAIRTGAVTGVSVRHLAPAGATTLGLLGCGVQAFDQVRHACAAQPLERVLLHSRSRSSAESLRDRLAPELPQLSVEVASSLEQLIQASQILITATSSRTPVLPDDPAAFEGKHCVAIGSFESDVREYPDAIFSRTAQVWVDTPHAMAESGELSNPLERGILHADQVQTLGALIASGAEPNRGEYGTTFFKSVGMALFDLQAARAVHAAAVERGLGTQLAL
ncbi:MAG: ornithine cyclodeaminase/alanine dehydrogenase-like protein (mu-crystallin family) [Planctomycetota bacterium]|jgi:ornithine cyclodeaminase/alanine dehydrogenase-like protein (mu-crystallin family)